MDTNLEVSIPITRDTDILLACQKSRTLASHIGLSGNDQVSVVISVSEIARNMLLYAGQGRITLKPVEQNQKKGLKVVAQDRGPGIADIDLVMQDGYSTGGSLGLGLSGAGRLMDEFEINSQPGEGTTITMTKWR